MANVYTDSTALTTRVGAARLTALQDRNADGSADSGVLTAAIERAGRIINRRLRQRYGSSIPFAQLTDTPATPEEIQKIAEDLVLYDLYSFFEPEGRDAKYHEALAIEALDALRNGEDDIDVARAAAHEGKFIAVYDAEDPVFSGVDDDGVSRMRGI